MFIIEGMYKYLEDEPLTTGEELKGEESHVEFSGTHEEEVFGYCTEFILQLNKDINVEEFDEKVILDEITPLGNSIAIVKDEDIVKVHIHTLTPGNILNIGQKYGEFLTLKIENMSSKANNPQITAS